MHLDFESIPYVGKLAPRLMLPNDLVVEDESVDMSKAVLPSEIVSPSQYSHVRAYVDCARVTHSGVHKNVEVFDEVARNIADWCGAPLKAPIPGRREEPAM
jgi:hypothetical protein